MTTKTDKNDFQDKLLSALRQEQISVSIFLVNGIRLQGYIEAFDAYVVLLKSDGITQAIYKHAMSTILPSRSVSLDGPSSPEVVIKKRTPFGLKRISKEELDTVE